MIGKVALLLMGIVSLHHVQCQTCVGAPGYEPGSDACCNNPALTGSVFAICCKDNSTGVSLCYCNTAQYQMCSKQPVVATQAPAPAAPLRYCPATPQLPVVTSRLVGATRVDDACSGRGTIGLLASDSQFCNAVFVIDPVTGERVMYTITECWEALEDLKTKDITIVGEVFPDKFPLDDCAIQNTTTSADNDLVTKVTLSAMAGFFVEKHLDNCSSPGCIYNSTLMSNAVDLSNCFTASYGFSSLTEPVTGELQRLSLKISDATMCRDPPQGSQCFVSATPNQGSTCIGDKGAPVYCQLSTGEQVLYGVTYAKNCDGSNHAFNVIPIPRM